MGCLFSAHLPPFFFDQALDLDRTRRRHRVSPRLMCIPFTLLCPSSLCLLFEWLMALDVSMLVDRGLSWSDRGLSVVLELPLPLPSSPRLRCLLLALFLLPVFFPAKRVRVVDSVCRCLRLSSVASFYISSSSHAPASSRPMVTERMKQTPPPLSFHPSDLVQKQTMMAFFRCI